MSFDELMAELPKLTPAEREEVRLHLDRLDYESDASWRQEIQRRVADIESGRESGVDGDLALAELRKIAGR